MKKTAIYIYLALALSVLAIFAYIRISSFHTITFKLSQTTLDVIVYRKDDKGRSSKVSEFKTTTKLTLENGSYYYFVTGDHIAPASINFDVKNSQEVTIAPQYTKEYLASLLDSELGAINPTISSYSPIVDTYFNINRGLLFGQGEWYGTTLTAKTDDPKQPNDDYRVVLKKDNGTWKLLGKPELILSAPDYPSVPKDILSVINQIDPSQTPVSDTKASLD